MPMLEKYRDYFDIDPDFFPAVNEAVIMKNPEMLFKGPTPLSDTWEI